mmetsp:Transcript_22936/g.50701  ORF Transcript_22936/g.50701 Transcript_22936/m.50701 type:complete len:233 (+) Transcript_22936:631-1329(+)
MSPRPWSKTISTGTRESAQPRTAARGDCFTIRARRSKALLSGRVAVFIQNRVFPRCKDSKISLGSIWLVVSANFMDLLKASSMEKPLSSIASHTAPGLPEVDTAPSDLSLVKEPFKASPEVPLLIPESSALGAFGCQLPCMYLFMGEDSAAALPPQHMHAFSFASESSDRDRRRLERLRSFLPGRSCAQSHGPTAFPTAAASNTESKKPICRVPPASWLIPGIGKNLGSLAL